MSRILEIAKKVRGFILATYQYVNERAQRLWQNRKGRVVTIIALSILGLCLALYGLFFQAPHNTFRKHSLFSIPEGATLSQISQKLHNQGYIISPFWFKVLVSVKAGSGSVQAGDYFFSHAQNTFTVVSRLTTGDYNLEAERITIPEGLTMFEIADLFAKDFPQFNKADFIRTAPEGYLFPDTYFFLPNVKAKEVMTSMQQNFARQIVAVKEDVTKFAKPLGDVIKMASILEKEARTFEVRQTVAGILWKRIKIGMPLQVDASFEYINGKNSFTLTTEDLAIDSLYNSYVYKGLPPTPISNPGLESIQAAISPIETDYFYFLTDKNGVMRYSVDYDGHLKNRRLYLGK